MRIKVEQLEQQLSSGLPRVIVLSGDEPLQREECLDSIRRTAREEGYEERVSFAADARFDWQEIEQLGDNLSLFASRRLIEVRLLAMPSDAGRKFLQRFCEQARDDLGLCLIADRFDGRQLKSKWVSSLDKAGVIVQIWTIDVSRLPRWVAERAKRLGVVLASDGAQLLAERSEGNLLACAQELHKLVLLQQGSSTSPAVPLDAEAVRAAVSDSARFDAFDLVDAALAGESARVSRIIAALRDEGVQIPAVLGAFCWALRAVTEVSVRHARGEPLDAIVTRHLSAWRSPQRRRLLEQAIRRHRPGRWQSLLRRASHVDAMSKGQAIAPIRGGSLSSKECWGEFEALALGAAGVTVLSSSRYTLGW